MIATLLALIALSSTPQSLPGFKLPAGFAIDVYADASLANDIYAMTIDDAGRVLVAGRGYVRVLVDDDGDGRADRAIDLFDNFTDGAMGLLAEGDSLYVVAGGAVKRYRGYNGRDKLKLPGEIILSVKASGEHEAHAIRRGPDGWLYLLCGNMAGVKFDKLDRQHSPITELVAGCLLRIRPDEKAIEIVSDGFRNPYSFDFNRAGEPFTFDSDNERCIGLPWYEGCRFYHIVPSGNYGWRSPQFGQTWRKPPYMSDNVAPICDTGRGSPTGVVCYRQSLFPQRFHNGFFIADWTFGRIQYITLEPNQTSFKGVCESFLEATGENGFAPTSLAVHPITGDLLVSIGGRGTRGGVYRIGYPPGHVGKMQPIASRSLDYNEGSVREWLAESTGGDLAKRRLALDMLFRWRDKIDDRASLHDAIVANLNQPDALLRAASARLAVACDIPFGKELDRCGSLEIAIARQTKCGAKELATAVEALGDKSASTREKLLAVRVIQLASGDLTAAKANGTFWEGYTLRRPVQAEGAIANALEASYSGSDSDLDREIERTLAGLEFASPEFIARVIAQITPKSKAQRDIHHLAVLARLHVRDFSFAPKLARALLDLELKVGDQKIVRDRNWPLCVAAIAKALANSTLAKAVLADERFGLPEHAMFVQPLDLDREIAARRFLRATDGDPDYAWTPTSIGLLAALPVTETRPTLLKVWSRGGLQDSIVLVLASSPDPLDEEKYLTGLGSAAPEVVRLSSVALAKIPAANRDKVIVAAIRALQLLPADKTTQVTREALAALLTVRTYQKFGTDAKLWREWLISTDPKLAASLDKSDGFDAIAWKKRVDAIPWEKGDVASGRKIFVRATCSSCHDGGGAVGPSLAGISKRFGRDDLLTAIFQPSRDISPRYRSTRIVTTDAKAYIGMIVYEAVDGIILQTGPDTTIRVPGDQIESKRILDTSLMPAGLLDKLSDQEIADLLAYLRGG